ncbi:hypothetical protein BD289DRAFT_217804 [Coniella lustricola]|uniref:Uncharacterized protein n=1 Tax=Coniella lustricola TaxID=2025994 RepID=A0A2T2ZS24_9PEZI|nr:hypothetical protein BD289DRAFT_217804 [Coniella lustricola]
MKRTKKRTNEKERKKKKKRKLTNIHNNQINANGNPRHQGEHLAKGPLVVGVGAAGLGRHIDAVDGKEAEKGPHHGQAQQPVAQAQPQAGVLPGAPQARGAGLDLAADAGAGAQARDDVVDPPGAVEDHEHVADAQGGLQGAEQRRALALGEPDGLGSLGALGGKLGEVGLVGKDAQVVLVVEHVDGDGKDHDEEPEAQADAAAAQLVRQRLQDEAGEDGKGRQEDAVEQVEERVALVRVLNDGAVAGHGRDEHRDGEEQHRVEEALQGLFEARREARVRVAPARRRAKEGVTKGLAHFGGQHNVVDCHKDGGHVVGDHHLGVSWSAEIGPRTDQHSKTWTPRTHPDSTQVCVAVPVQVRANRRVACRQGKVGRHGQIVRVGVCQGLLVPEHGLAIRRLRPVGRQEGTHVVDGRVNGHDCGRVHGRVIFHLEEEVGPKSTERVARRGVDLEQVGSRSRPRGVDRVRVHCGVRKTAPDRLFSVVSVCCQACLCSGGLPFALLVTLTKLQDLFSQPLSSPNRRSHTRVVQQKESSRPDKVDNKRKRLKRKEREREREWLFGFKLASHHDWKQRGTGKNQNPKNNKRQSQFIKCPKAL